MDDRYELISERSAWRSAAIGGKEGLTLRLNEAQLAGLDRLLQATRHLPCESITREMFDEPAVNALMAQIVEELAEGRGALVVQALPMDKYDADELVRIYWGMGTHLGIAAPQNTVGDRIDHVRDTENNPLGRRQYGTQELVLHTDNVIGQTLALLCMHKSISGGVSQLASALAVHNEIVSTRPDLLAPLYEGYPYHRKGKQREGDPLITPFNVPIFSKINGLVSVRYIRDYMEKAALEKGVDMPAKTREALDLFDQISNRDDMSVRFMLEPGEIMLINNLTVLHARTEFVDHPEVEHKRHLVRLWIKVPNGRPYRPEMNLFYNGPADTRADGLTSALTY